jgi:hypothetical protein
VWKVKRERVSHVVGTLSRRKTPWKDWDRPGTSGSREEKRDDEWKDRPFLE